MIPLPVFRNEDVNEEAVMSPKGALDEYLFENVPVPRPLHRNVSFPFIITIPSSLTTNLA